MQIPHLTRCARILAAAAFLVPLVAQTPKRVLFDHTRHEEAGVSAEWVICTASEPDPTPANPTSETDWNGGISAWAFDLFKAGYKVQSLPPSGRVTYGDVTNTQDLSNYQVYIIDEPYVLFSAAEKQAIFSYVQNGGGLFIVCNHIGAARYSGGTDAYTVFNDMVNMGGANPYGFTFVAGHGPGDAQANTTSTAFSAGTDTATQAIVHGAFGGLSLMDFHSYSYVSYDTSLNPSVKEILHTQVSGDTGSFIVTCTVGAGRVVAISDTAPADDGTTTTSGKRLHSSYTINSNKAFFLNSCAYLAGSGSAQQPPVVSIVSPSSNVSVTTGSAVSFQGSATDPNGSALNYSWAFGDGSSAAVQGPVSHSYSSTGTYTATFTATNTQNLSNSATRTITVTPATNTVTASIATPSGNVTLGSGVSQSFIGSATDSSSAATLSYAWDFGDGTTATGATASHAFTNATASSKIFTVTFTATDNTGASSSVTRTMTVTPINTAPSITSQPTNAMVNSGTAATFSVTASGTAPLSYQWRKNGSNISGATSASYTTPATVSGDNGSTFSVVVTNSAGSATSNNATLTVVTVSGTTFAEVEPNNTIATANVVGSSYTAIQGNLPTTTDVDYFALTLTPGQTVAIAMTGPTGPDWDLYLKNSAGTTLTSSTGGTTTENLSYTNSGTTNKTVYANVIVYATASTSPYTLALSYTGGGPVDNIPPTVSASESGTSGTITFSATASDNVGVTKVEFYVDGSLKGTSTTSPYSMTFNSTGLSNGSHALVAKAYDAAGNIGISSSVSFSISNATTSQELILNGGFESGATAWAGTTGDIGAFSGEPAYAGANDCWLLGNGATATENIAQTVSIPASAVSATLSFWMHIDTAETTTTAIYDTMAVQVRNSSGTVLGTLATYSNLNKSNGFVQKTFDLSAYKGQTVQIYFLGNEDASLQTSFVLDEVSVMVQ